MPSKVYNVIPKGKYTNITFESSLSDIQAIDFLRKEFKGNSYAQALVRQWDNWNGQYSYPLSRNQISWVHYLIYQREQIQEQDRIRYSRIEGIALKGEDQMVAILDLFSHAVLTGLRRPKIRLVVEAPERKCFCFNGTNLYSGQPCAICDGKQVYSTRSQYFLTLSKKEGWLNVRPRYGMQIGEISSDGLFIPSRNTDPSKYKILIPQLQALAENPQKVAREYGKLLGVCCFCGLTLTDERSTEVGYGPVCATRWNFPWGLK